MPTRRDFIYRLAASGVLASQTLSLTTPMARGKVLPRSDSAQGIKVDMLCYESNLTSQMIDNVIRAGLTAVVFDLALWPREYAGAVRELALWAERFGQWGDKVLSVRQASDFKRAEQEHKLGIVLACQDATILGAASSFEAPLHMFHALGLRVLQLTHNQRTQWGDSFMEKKDGGLSRAGEQLVSAMNRLGMIIDLSHCSPQTLFDAVQVSKQPCAVTHAGCKALAPTARNKSDDEIKALGRAGGLFGVYNMTTWLTTDPTASLKTVIEHIDHAVQLIGPSQVGFGSDGALDQLNAVGEATRMGNVQKANNGGPSAEWPVRHIRVPELNAPGRLTALAEGLSRRGYSDTDIDGIIGGNFVRLFQRVCG